MSKVWRFCLERLEQEFPDGEVGLWLRPIQGIEQAGRLRLFVPNAIFLDRLKDRYLERIEHWASETHGREMEVELTVGSLAKPSDKGRADSKGSEKASRAPQHNVDRRYQFGNFVQGRSNQLAHAAAQQVAENLGAYNPLLLYGGTGLGKTHLLHAVGNVLCDRDAHAQVVYLHSERFVSDMIYALRHNSIDAFKKRYRSVQALLIDDIQFFANKDRSQEEFFHTFNALLQEGQQIIMSCDRYPKEVNGLEDRLKSRCGWGLCVAIEPPDFETRVAILLAKAAATDVNVSEEAAYFIAEHVRSNVRDLEGALNTLVANARFMDRPATLDFAKETLRDMIAVHQRLVTMENIQKTVVDYYRIRASDLSSRRRTRSITRPRQLAMALAKELTEHSLPEIGDAFGGRDHSTVLHACRRIDQLRTEDARIAEDYTKILRTLTA